MAINIFDNYGTDAFINDVDAALEAGQQEEAFHKLSLTHSTLLHHRMIQRLYKPRLVALIVLPVQYSDVTEVYTSVFVGTILLGQTI